MRSLIPALAPCSLNFTGIVLPRLNTELPSGLIGWRKNAPSIAAWYSTQTTNDFVVVLPAASAAPQKTVVFPGVNVDPEAGAQLTGTEPSTSSVALGSG